MFEEMLQNFSTPEEIKKILKLHSNGGLIPDDVKEILKLPSSGKIR